LQNNSHKKFHRGRRRKSGTVGYIAVHQHIKTFFNGISFFLKGPDNPLWIIGPSRTVPIYKIVQACLDNSHFTEILRIETDFSVLSFPCNSVGADGQSTGKYMSPVVISVFTDKIYPAWRKIEANVSSISKKFLKLLY